MVWEYLFTCVYFHVYYLCYSSSPPISVSFAVSSVPLRGVSFCARDCVLEGGSQRVGVPVIGEGHELVEASECLLRDLLLLVCVLADCREDAYGLWVG